MRATSKLVAAFLLVGSAFTPAFAGEAPKQNHHCKLPDGTMDMSKTKRACKAAKGTWAKDAPAADAKPADAKPADAKPADAKPAN